MPLGGQQLHMVHSVAQDSGRLKSFVAPGSCCQMELCLVQVAWATFPGNEAGSTLCMLQNSVLTTYTLSGQLQTVPVPASVTSLHPVLQGLLLSVRLLTFLLQVTFQNFILVAMITPPPLRDFCRSLAKLVGSPGGFRLDPESVVYPKNTHNPLIPSDIHVKVINTLPYLTRCKVCMCCLLPSARDAWLELKGMQGDFQELEKLHRLGSFLASDAEGSYRSRVC